LGGGSHLQQRSHLGVEAVLLDSVGCGGGSSGSHAVLDVQDVRPHLGAQRRHLRLVRRLLLLEQRQPALPACLLHLLRRHGLHLPPLVLLHTVTGRLGPGCVLE
jgi:hypothetical protein